MTFARCPTGTFVLGGGYRILAPGAIAKLIIPARDAPASARAWRVAAAEGTLTPGKWSLQAFALCGRSVLARTPSSKLLFVALVVARRASWSPLPPPRPG